MKGLEVVKCSLLDIDGVLKLEDECLYDRYSEDTIRNMLNMDTYRVYIGIVDNKCVGYVSYSVVDREGELIKVVVAKKFRNKGYGYDILNKTLDYISGEGVENVFLEVRCDNLSAISLYEKLNFQKINIRQKYYDNVVDAVIYRKCLDVKNKL